MPNSLNATYRPTPHLSRREMLRASGLGFGWMALGHLLQAEGVQGGTVGAPRASHDLRPRVCHFPPRARSVIQLVQTGGPSQMDLFDPKPELTRRDGQTYDVKVESFQPGSEANKLMASPFRFQPRGQCGMELSELIPHVSSIADELCLVRSMVSEHNNHTEAIVMLASGKIFQGRPTLGAWVSYALGTENQNLPSFVVLRDPEGYSTSGGLMSKSGFLPAIYGGTELRAEGVPVHNLQPAEPVSATARRRDLEFLARMNERHRQVFPHESGLESRIRNYELAARMQLSATTAIDLSTETDATKKLYGLDNPKTRGYGTRCLMARRLVESGVRFVQVFAAKGQPWDHHSDINTGLPDICASTDQSSAALVTDLKNRGLLDSTIVLWCGEFGRLPVSQGGTGRDHNKNAGSLWLAGGGFRGGYVHGKTDDVGYTVVEDRLSVPDLFATIMHQLGMDHQQLTYPHAGRDESVTDFPVTGAHVHDEVIDGAVHTT